MRTTAVVKAANYTGSAILPQYGIVRASFNNTGMSGSIRADGLKLLYNGSVLAQMDEAYSDVIAALNTAGLEYTEDGGAITVVPYGDERQISLLFNKSDNALYSVYVARYVGSISKFYYEQENANQ